MSELIDTLSRHPLFDQMLIRDLQLIAACGKPQSFPPGTYLGRENQSADHFYLIHSGQVAIEIFFPDRGPLTLQTLGDGDVVGWSWLFPPYRWAFDIRARTEVQSTALDGLRLRTQCAREPRLGYELMRRFAAIMTERLQATRLQLVDLYSHQPVGQL